MKIKKSHSGRSARKPPVSAKAPASAPLSFDARRAALVTRIAALFLARGLAEIPLRELARELDTSDRMLLYYFKDKTDLVTAALSEISADLRQVLQMALPSARVAPAQLLNQVTSVLGSRPVRPFMRVWADLVAHGTRGEAPFRALVSASAAGWLERIEARLQLPDGAHRRRAAVAILTIAEGSRMLEDALPGCTADTLQIFVAGFERNS